MFESQKNPKQLLIKLWRDANSCLPFFCRIKTQVAHFHTWHTHQRRGSYNIQASKRQGSDTKNTRSRIKRAPFKHKGSIMCAVVVPEELEVWDVFADGSFWVLAGLCFLFLHFISHKVGKMGFRSKCFTCLMFVRDYSHTNGSNDGSSGEISSCEMIWSRPMI